MSAVISTFPILAVDPGEKRIGLAMSDPNGTFAVPLETAELKPGQSAAEVITEACALRDIRTVVMGYPLIKGTHQTAQTRKVDDLCQELRQKLLEVIPVDEALTSAEADRTMRLGNEKQTLKNKGRRDQLAAWHLLNDFLATLL